MFSLIKGGTFQDERGTMRFANDFLMDQVKRMYIIEPRDTTVIRAWQAHKEEQKWFFVLEGSFEVKLVQPDNWELPSKKLPVQSLTLAALSNEVLHIPGGYANGFKALEAGSKLLVFSDTEIKHASEDNYRFDKDYWDCW
ncbi:WxcM-like domain-containing protein [Arachidicoccus sp.]|uniref:WxcM-like domain-containing protein n=1 Tax=Arachidicoccus sp. TaxID=1872624 RepID=UPI003D1B2BCD